MADDALILRITAKTDEFVKTIQDAQTKVKSLTTQMQEIDKQLKTENVDKVGKLSEKLELAKRASEAASKEVKLYGEKLAALTKGHEDASTMTDRQRSQVLKLSEQMASAQQRSETLAAQVQELASELENAGKASDDAAEKIEETGEAAEKASSGTWSLGNAIKADLISSAIKTGLKTVGNLMANIAKTAINAAKKVGQFAVEAIDLAKDMEETKSKVSAVFGPEGQKEIEEWASNASHDFHTTKQAAMESVSAFGNILLNMGMASQEAQKYSQDLVLVAAAQADFNNMDTGEVLDKIQSALAGNYKGLQSLGIVLKETDITERALLATGKEKAEQLTDLEKKQAALQIITEKSSFAVEKYKENSGSLVSMQGELQAKLQDVKTEIGERLYPVAESLFNKIIDFTNSEQFSDLLDTIYDSVEEIGTSVTNFIESGQLEEWITWVQNQLPTLGDKIADIAGKVADIVDGIWDAIAAFRQWKEDTKEDIRSGLESLPFVHNLPVSQSRASGGPVLPGQMYRVNDNHGRQIEGFVPSVPGYILNGSDTSKIINNSTNNSRSFGDLNVYVTSYGTDAASIADEIGAAVNQKLRLSGAML